MRGFPFCIRPQQLRLSCNAFSPDGEWLASGSWDKTARIWDAWTGEPCAVLNHPDVVWALAFGPDGSWLATSCHENNQLRNLGHRYNPTQKRDFAAWHLRRVPRGQFKAGPDCRDGSTSIGPVQNDCVRRVDGQGDFCKR